MAALVEGENYGLSSKSPTSSSKTVIQLKLTDAALLSINEHLKNAISESPTISFDGNHGVLSIPSDTPTSFRFTTSGIQGDPNGSFDCIKQTNKKQHGSGLDLVGSISKKITIHANDDVYRTTRERMNQVEEDVKKVCAKEIKLRGKFMSHKVKKVLKSNPCPLPPTNVKPSQNSLVNKPAVVNKPPVVSKPSVVNKHVASTDHGRALANISGSNISGSASSSSRRPPTNSKSSPNSAVINLPYRERIIHILALRPYKKPELIYRLQQGGVKEKDKSTLTQVLQQVATFCHRDNSYSLAKHMLPEVKLDWPDYSETDRQIIKRRKMADTRQSTTPDTRQSTTPSPSTSPPVATSSPNSKSHISVSQKRHSEGPTDPLAPKKIRISHYDQKKNINEPKAEPMDTSLVSNDSKPEPLESTFAIDKSIESSYSPSKKENSEYSSQFPDYIQMYQPIKSIEDRRRLKEIFTGEFNEYLELHGNVEKIRRKFLELDEKLRNSTHGSDDYQNWKKQIYSEYNEQRNKGYYKRKARYEYLYNKLSHIKKLISDFDRPTIKAC